MLLPSSSWVQQTSFHNRKQFYKTSSIARKVQILHSFMQATVDNDSCIGPIWIWDSTNVCAHLQRYAGCSQVSIISWMYEKLLASNDYLVHVCVFRSVEDSETTSMIVAGIASSALSFGYSKTTIILKDSVATKY